MSGQAIRFLIDSNFSDVVAADEWLLTALRGAVDRGDVILLITHIQVDENLDHPDPEAGRRLIHAILGAGVRAIPTYGLVLDVSRLGNARLFDDATAAMFEAFVQGNANHSQDGLLASTALHEGAILVTGENEQHRRRLKRHFRGLRVWTPDDLIAYVAALRADAFPQPGSLASGTLVTPEFDGPGERTASIRLGITGVKTPELVISLLPEALSLEPPSRIGSTFAYTVSRDAGGHPVFSVIVTRPELGRERAHVFRWELWDGARRDEMGPRADESG